jgi:hypothetical protein
VFEITNNETRTSDVMFDIFQILKLYARPIIQIISHDQVKQFLILTLADFCVQNAKNYLFHSELSDVTVTVLSNKFILLSYKREMQ